MFHPTQPLGKALRRLRLTTKMVNKGYYKGNRTGRTGTHTKWGGYIIDPALVRTYKVPAGLAKFDLTPFVTEKIARPHVDEEAKSDTKYKVTGADYLQKWKEENGET